MADNRKVTLDSRIEDELNSMSFDGDIYLAISNTFPITGRCYRCWRTEMSDGEKPTLRKCRTSIVTGILYLGNNIFRVTTMNSIYIVKTIY